jgi:hypothetical protein
VTTLPLSLAAKLVALKLGGEFLSRAPKDWQSEAAHALGYGPRRIPKELLPVRTAIEAARAEALEQVLIASAWVLVAACRRAQQLKRGSSHALRFGAVSPEAIRLAIPADQLWLLGLGPKRGIRRALADAAARHPSELWRDRKGWRSLGSAAPRPPAPQPERQGRTRSGLAVARNSSGSGG